MISALLDFGIEEEDLDKLSQLDFTKTQLLFFCEKPSRIDFLNKINNVSYEDAVSNVNYFPIGNHQIPVINYGHLILSKISNERPQDKAEVEKL